MPKGTSPGTKRTQFKKGQSGNPHGRKAMPPEVKEIKKLTAATYIEIVGKYFHINLDQLERKLRDKKTTTLELMVGKVIAYAIKQGDYKRLEALLFRVIGHPANTAGEGGLDPTIVIERPDGTKVILGREDRPMGVE